MKNINLKILVVSSVIIFSCGKNYHDGKYSDSDIYKPSIGTNDYRKNIMDSIFFDAMTGYLRDIGTIKNNEDLTIGIAIKVEKLDLKYYNSVNRVLPNTYSLRGIDFFKSLKELDVKNSKINDTDTTRFKSELIRIRKSLNLDTTKIYHNYNIRWGVL